MVFNVKKLFFDGVGLSLHRRAKRSNATGMRADLVDLARMAFFFAGKRINANIYQ
jgi:hypothetical protein